MSRFLLAVIFLAWVQAGPAQALTSPSGLVSLAGAHRREGLLAEGNLEDASDRSLADGSSDITSKNASLGHWNNIVEICRNIRKSPLKQTNETSAGFSAREYTVGVVGFLLVGAIAYSIVFEHWSLVDSLYFSLTVLTTVGYGDVIPSTFAGRLFTCIFGLGGIAFIGAALTAIGSMIMESEVKAIEEAQRASRRRLMNIFEGMPHVLDRFHKDKSKRSIIEAEGMDNACKVIEEELKPKVATWRKMLRNVIFEHWPITLALTMVGTMIGRLEGWTLSQAIYYSITTGSTIGFGDLSPQTRLGRIYALFFIPLAVAAAGKTIGTGVSYILDRRRSKYVHHIVHQDINANVLASMDENKSGEVSRNEYVEYMLIKLSLVDKETLDDLHEQFTRLDLTNTGTLNKRDLELMAELRGKVSTGKGDSMILGR
mmetsp:Transcript_23894/g.34952  ORF Transcript_23894/g.34952 Transcript_23894/m.34952 type:complete len:428 (+) Transcript_23894:129-1412(+)|eukprot:CAMPEP_0195518400 /NCGR_PEP_ID=MMETSP0794_2-20130614/12799_1 /TAXON_ID=515487 /ORGANISM="Stephanopyxis turris, Strain CCMP 815" /LENGTH=427 /DNA_ID=CAMNT_0040647353 /DNA_START=124 /DNA_END=1407 /DNA_ORIENTATION=+